ncbi:MAG: hypothetical protein HN948_03670 [Clostridia bacterium]|nr:hypothetical protein [Clostridia bacterium]MBT7122092.1 hypothetical protein [Clostridia bacterium]
MKKGRLVIFIIVISAMLFGCVAVDNQPEDAATPKQTTTGGVSEPADNINVKEIDITQHDEQTVITLYMLSGSRANGYTESKLVDLPEYEISMLAQPERLKIVLDNISFWDYEEKPTWALNSFVVDLFKEVPADNNTLVFYIQLTQTAAYTVQEIDGNLVITLMPGEPLQGVQFFCVTDAFLEHQEGLWPSSIDMQPVLCSDSINKLLISKPFSTQFAAQEFMAQKNQFLSSAQLDKTIYVISLMPGTLPNYEIDSHNPQLDEMSVVMKEGVLMSTPLLLENGKYLAAAPDGRIAFSRSYKPDEPSLQQDNYLLSEKLWIQDPNSRIADINVPEFFSIDKAAFSFDGSYIAILDVSIENSVLYVYDFEAESFYNLGEEGFGNLTDSFAWSDTKNTLFAMTGSGTGATQLMGCDLSREDELNIFAVEETPGSSGTLIVSQDRIFFADKIVADGGIIYEIGETRREITSGVDFIVSDDGKTMLILESFAGEGEERTVNLKLCNIATSQCTYIAQNVQIENYSFSQNGNKVYYTTTFVDDGVDDYIYGFVCYDIVTGVSETIAHATTGNFSVGMSPSEIYFLKEIIDTEQNFIATFIYDLSL